MIVAPAPPAESASTAPAMAPAGAAASSAPPPQARLGGTGAGEALTPPSYRAAYLQNPPPRYPVSARRNGEEGTVMLRVLVTPDGRPGKVQLERSSGSPALDSAALEAVERWRFVPARRGSESVEAWVLVPLVFRLEAAN
ncbi:MAG: energy transducer TonB [Burkholderiales bacterium]|nr:energy transducer TonB [Burkholderiales bacterium]